MLSRKHLHQRNSFTFPHSARLFACALLCLICCCNLSQAQTSTTRVEGLVQDPAGAPIAGAEVTLKKESRAIAEVLTDSDGHFQIEAATTQDAILSIHAQGFTSFEGKLSALQTSATAIKIILAPAPLSEQVTVIATRTESRLGDTAASIATLSQSELSTTAAETLDDVLRQVPGFSLFRRSGSRTANPTTQGVSLRGVGASGASRAVVLADGIPLNDPFGGWVYWSRIPRTSVSSIEVLRGGASHLYGSDALGGVINIFTREPRAPVLLLETSYGNQQTADANVYAGTRKGQWGLSLAAETFRTDGYIIVDERERGRVDTPANSRNAVLNLLVERSLSKVGNVFARASFFGEARSNGTPFQTNRTHLRQFVLGGDIQNRQAGAFSLRAYGGTQVFDQNFSAVSADRNSETLTRLQRVPAQSTGASFQWSRALEKRQTLVAGLDEREVRGASDETVFVAGRASSTVGAGGRERTFGLFLEDIMHLTPNLYVTLGARLDRWRNFAALSVTRPLTVSAPTTTNTFPDRTESAFSPQLSLLYKPRNNLSLYASTTRAFRAPTLNELYRTFRVGDALTLANENLRAERLSGAEAGASLNTFKQKLNLRSSFFWTETTRPVANVTLRVQPGLITRQRQNLGSTRSRGLEVDGEARLTNHLTVAGGYLLADATVLSFPANTALEGLLIPQIARHQLTFQARYADASVINVGLQGRASSGQFDDDQNRFHLDKYFTLDVLASRPLTHGLEAFAAIENLFNQRYAVGLTPVKTIGPPLSMRFGIRLHLGSQ